MYMRSRSPIWEVPSALSEPPWPSPSMSTSVAHPTKKSSTCTRAYDMEIFCSSSLVLFVSGLRIIFCISIAKRRNGLCSVSDPSRVPNKENGLDGLENYRNTYP